MQTDELFDQLARDVHWIARKMREALARPTAKDQLSSGADEIAIRDDRLMASRR